MSMRLRFSPLGMRRVQRFQNGRLDYHKWEMVKFDPEYEFSRDYLV